MTRTSYRRTAAQITQTRDRAVAAVRQLLAATPDTPASDQRAAEQHATDRVTAAWRLDRTTPAQIAAAAGCRELHMVRLVGDEDGRAAALVAARHDARRYLAAVEEAIRREALARWNDAATAAGWVPRGTKSRICRELDIRRGDLDAWLREAGWRSQGDD